jgi:hypothetical protein
MQPDKHTLTIAVLAGFLLIVTLPAGGQVLEENPCEPKPLSHIKTQLQDIQLPNKIACDKRKSPYIDRKPTPRELEEILTNHLKWLTTKPEVSISEEQANFCGADLTKVDLHRTSTNESELSPAFLRKAILTKAKLRGADLRSVNLAEADLRGADLREAKLCGADLRGAILDWANLSGANLTDVSLGKVTLGSSSTQSNMSLGPPAHLEKANLTRTIFEVKLGSLPDILSIAHAQNLSQMTFSDSRHAMVELRDEFRKAGQYEQERAVTYALKRTDRERTPWPIGPILWLAFEQTCAWGMSPERPLMILAWFILGFTAIYMYPLMVESRGEILIEWPENLGRTRASVESFSLGENRSWTRLCVISFVLYFMFASFIFYITWCALNVDNRIFWIFYPLTFLVFVLSICLLLPYLFTESMHVIHVLRALISAIFSKNRVDKQGRTEEPTWEAQKSIRPRYAQISPCAIGASFYFSLLSAFQIGWREFNVGNWISRLQPGDYALQASGFFRTISGIQSLISVYLLALSVLTYFGRLFE